MSSDTITIEPKETGTRLLFSVLFAIVTVALVAILGVMTAFALISSLVTRRAPSDYLRRFANQTVSYLYRVLRYVTYNDTVVPFPFSDFPPELEPCVPLPRPTQDTSATASEQPFSPSDLHYHDEKGSTPFTIEERGTRETSVKHQQY